MSNCDIVFIPGADGIPFHEDTEAAHLSFARTHLLAFPNGERSSVATYKQYFQMFTESLRRMIESIRKMNGDGGVYAVGRNFGGSLLAHAASAVTLEGIVVVGSIPDMSRFLTESPHPQAVAFRTSYSGALVDFAPAVRELDLVASLETLDADMCYLQIGRQDPWLDATSLRIYKTLGKTFSTKFYDDGHTVDSIEAVEDRLSWMIND